ncbi:DUF4278 domain-containing protein [Spirulina major CS-329]|uniref:DUF4278 domain-containing protein n=1 Tax=Spirulina TaxID=1154 RepID=UPI00232D4D85|nr:MULTISPECIES: DUF4278 domain-containing protein [Spirulina]MDB9494245.1 DUF4278 domain-containing protein [Spirulina subsalsa CS-330]MDB9501840.1 DUF4278 domain-containing protein [Spirulina major CS-329]
MQLSYRGVIYKPQHTTVDVKEGEVAGQYRGAPWRVHRYSQCPHSLQQDHELIYRGIHYKH